MVEYIKTYFKTQAKYFFVGQQMCAWQETRIAKNPHPSLACQAFCSYLVTFLFKIVGGSLYNNLEVLEAENVTLMIIQVFAAKIVGKIHCSIF